MRHLAFFESMAFALSSSAFFSAPIFAMPVPRSSGTKNYHRLTRRSRYWPHQGERRERARRLRQLSKT